METAKSCATTRWFAASTRLAPLLMTVACQSGMSAAGPAAVPARMLAEQTSQQCLAQMQTAAERPGGNRVVLGTAAFAQSDRLSIAPAQTQLDAAGQIADGRMLGAPDRYRLTLKQGMCTMTREADAQATVLSACTCVALP